MCIATTSMEYCVTDSSAQAHSGAYGAWESLGEAHARAVCGQYGSGHAESPPQPCSNHLGDTRLCAPVVVCCGVPWRAAGAADGMVMAWPDESGSGQMDAAKGKMLKVDKREWG